MASFISVIPSTSLARPPALTCHTALPAPRLTSLRSALYGRQTLVHPTGRSSAFARRPRRGPCMVATGEPLEDWLDRVDRDLGKCTRGIFRACKEIAYKIRTASCDKMACFNDFGDEQLAIDILADKCLFDHLQKSGVVATASSEEAPTENPMAPGGKFSVAFDPLDGSSIIDTNFSVGTIFGVWAGDTFIGKSGRDIVCAGLAIYGPRTTITLGIEGVPGAHEFLLIDDFSAQHGSWIHTNIFETVSEGKLFAPGNLRAAQDNPGYAKLLDYYFTEKYQLRYTGGMVPDVNQILVKGKGVFCAPASPSSKAKLRVLYEVLPIGYLMEKAGAKSSNGQGSVLDMTVSSTEDRSQVCYGSADEVSRFEELVGVKAVVSV